MFAVIETHLSHGLHRTHDNRMPYAVDEPVDNYAIDLFKGQHKPGSALTIVESYGVRAQKLATMSEQTFLASYGQVFRALPYLLG